MAAAVDEITEATIYDIAKKIEDSSKEFLNTLQFSEGLVRREIDLVRMEFEIRVKKLQSHVTSELKELVDHEKADILERLEEARKLVNSLRKTNNKDQYLLDETKMELDFIREGMLRKRLKFVANKDLTTTLDSLATMGHCTFIPIQTSEGNGNSDNVSKQNRTTLHACANPDAKKVCETVPTSNIRIHGENRLNATHLSKNGQNTDNSDIANTYMNNTINHSPKEPETRYNGTVRKSSTSDGNDSQRSGLTTAEDISKTAPKHNTCPSDSGQNRNNVLHRQQHQLKERQDQLLKKGQQQFEKAISNENSTSDLPKKSDILPPEQLIDKSQLKTPISDKKEIPSGESNTQTSTGSDPFSVSRLLSDKSTNKNGLDKHMSRLALLNARISQLNDNKSIHGDIKPSCRELNTNGQDKQADKGRQDIGYTPLETKPVSNRDAPIGKAAKKGAQIAAMSRLQDAIVPDTDDTDEDINYIGLEDMDEENTHSAVSGNYINKANNGKHCDPQNYDKCTYDKHVPNALEARKEMEIDDESIDASQTYKEQYDDVCANESDSEDTGNSDDTDYEIEPMTRGERVARANALWFGRSMPNSETKARKRRSRSASPRSTRDKQQIETNEDVDEYSEDVDADLSRSCVEMKSQSNPQSDRYGQGNHSDLYAVNGDCRTEDNARHTRENKIKDCNESDDGNKRETTYHSSSGDRRTTYSRGNEGSDDHHTVFEENNDVENTQGEIKTVASGTTSSVDGDGGSGTFRVAGNDTRPDDTSAICDDSVRGTFRIDENKSRTASTSADGDNGGHGKCKMAGNKSRSVIRAKRMRNKSVTGDLEFDLRTIRKAYAAEGEYDVKCDLRNDAAMTDNSSGGSSIDTRMKPSVRTPVGGSDINADRNKYSFNLPKTDQYQREVPNDSRRNYDRTFSGNGLGMHCVDGERNINDRLGKEVPGTVYANSQLRNEARVARERRGSREVIDSVYGLTNKASGRPRYFSSRRRLHSTDGFAFNDS